jgi:hypothetical protein
VNDNPPLHLPPSAAEVTIDRDRMTELERHGGACPTCGQMIPAAVNRFSTGTHGLLPQDTRNADGPLDPDGPLGYAIHMALRNGESVEAICADADVTPQQVQGVADAYANRRSAA